MIIATICIVTGILIILSSIFADMKTSKPQPGLILIGIIIWFAGFLWTLQPEAEDKATPLAPEPQTRPQAQKSPASVDTLGLCPQR
jgi:hypothetical protein